MVQKPHGKQTRKCCGHLLESGVHEALSWTRSEHYCQQSQGLWAVSLACCGPLGEKLAIQETNTALGPRTEVMCMGPALVRKALAFRGRIPCIWPRLLAGSTRYLG